MVYNNYAISYARKKLYLKSKEPKEGFEKVTYGTDNKVTYHKYVDKIAGVLTSVEVKEVTFQNRKLHFFEVSLVDNDTTNKVSVSLKNASGRYTDEVCNLVGALRGADFGEEVTLTVTSTEGKNGKEYLNVYINYVNRFNDNNKGLSTGYIPYEEIPRAIKEEDPLLGTTYDWKPVERFYAGLIAKLVAKTAPTATTTPAATTTGTATAPKKESSIEEGVGLLDDMSDDLPF